MYNNNMTYNTYYMTADSLWLRVSITRFIDYRKAIWIWIEIAVYTVVTYFSSHVNPYSITITEKGIFIIWYFQSILGSRNIIRRLYSWIKRHNSHDMCRLNKCLVIDFIFFLSDLMHQFMVIHILLVSILLLHIIRTCGVIKTWYFGVILLHTI